MRICVITVTRNVEDTIAATLDSFCAQTHAAKHMLLIDGASSDRTVEIARNYPGQPITIISEPDRGMYDAVNKGLRRFSGDAVGLLNGDDAFHDRHALARIADGLTRSDIVHGHLDFVSDHHRKHIVRRWRARPAPSAGFRAGWMPAHPTFYVRRHVAEAVGPYDCALATAADYDWMVRALECHTFSLGIVPHILVDMRLGGLSTMSIGAHIRHNLEAMRSRRRWLGTPLVDYALLAKPIRKIGQFAWLGS